MVIRGLGPKGGQGNSQRLLVKLNASAQKFSVRKTKKMVQLNWVNVDLFVTCESCLSLSRTVNFTDFNIDIA